MNRRHIRFPAGFAATALTLLLSQGAAAQSSTEAVLYTYQGQAMTSYFRYGREGLVETRQVNLPGVAFNFYLETPLKAGETVSFQNPLDTSPTFFGVMGDNGLFETWRFSSWVNEYTRGSSEYRSSENAGGDEFNYVHPSPRVSTMGKTGAWTSAAVSKLPAGLSYRTAYATPWVSPVPEANTSAMAVLGLAAAGMLARRKAKAQAEPETTA